MGESGGPAEVSDQCGAAGVPVTGPGIPGWTALWHGGEVGRPALSLTSAPLQPTPCSLPTAGGFRGRSSHLGAESSGGPPS